MESSQKKLRYIMKNLIQIAVLVVIVGAAVFFNQSSYGEKLTFGKGEVYYTKNVTKAEARKLGNYLVQGGFFKDKPISVQLNKENGRYQFRMVTSEAYRYKKEYRAIARVMATEISRKVFNGQIVDLHICDNNLKTKGIEKCYQVKGFSNGEIYFTEKVTPKEVDIVGNFLKKKGLFKRKNISVGLDKTSAAYKVKTICNKFYLDNPAFQTLWKSYAQQLSKELKGATVEIHFCNPYFFTKKIVK